MAGVFAAVLGCARLWAGDLKVTLVNIGVGDAILVQTPDGKNIMVDGGYPEPGQSILIPYLKSMGVRRFHQLIATNQDTDHTGGLNAILGDTSFQVDSVLYSDSNIVANNRLSNLGSRPLVKLSTVTAPPAVLLDWDPELVVEVLNARDGQTPGNNNSITLKVTHSRVSFLLTGDIETPVVDDVVTNFSSEFPVTIVKVPHHGSNSSISSLFPLRTGAELAVVSGAKDANNNPDDSTLEAYGDAGIPVIRTDQRGHIAILSNGVTYSAATSAPPAGVTTVSAEPTVHAYPNPAPGKTQPAKATLVYDVNGIADEVRVAVYTVSGELLRAWESAPRALGVNYVEWDLKNGEDEDVASGLYFVQVEARAAGGAQTGRAKMAVLR